MIIVPSTWSFPGHRVYPDSDDQQLVYVDALQPTPARGHDVGRWFSLPSGQDSATLGQAYFTGEVTFGPQEKGFQEAAEVAAKRRAVPVPWGSGPVYLWVREEERAPLLARGKTSGYGAHNAVLSGTASAPKASSSLIVSAELSYQGRLAGAALRGSGRPAAVRKALEHASVGARAPRAATLAGVLVPLLRDLVNRRVLTLVAESVDLPLTAVEELQALGLMEWAHRIVAACRPPVESLAMPAALVDALDLSEALEMEIHWTQGDVVPVRAVRVLHPGGIAASEAAAQPARAVPVDKARKKAGPLEVAVLPGSDWSCFDYVEVALRCGEEATQLALTRSDPSRVWQPDRPGTEPLQAEASAMVRGYGVRVPLRDVHITGEGVRVSLLPVEERALLVREDRALLRQIGPHEVALAHPALAAVLVPEGGTLALSPGQGELRQRSLVYRALLWKTRAADPFHVTVRFPSGITTSWTDPARNAEIVVDAGRLPLLRVITASPYPAHPVEVELSQRPAGPCRRRRSLGCKEIRPGEQAAWVYDPDGGALLMRSKYTRTSGASYRTAWHPVQPDGTVLAPCAHLRKMAIVLTGAPGEALEVELAPSAGQGGKVRTTVAAGQARTVVLLDDADGGAAYYRTRNRGHPGGPAAPPWTPWAPVEGAFLRLSV